MIEHSNHWEFYRDRMKMWQWRKFAEKKVVAVSGDGYSSLKACVQDATLRGYVDPHKTYDIRVPVLAKS